MESLKDEVEKCKIMHKEEKKKREELEKTVEELKEKQLNKQMKDINQIQEKNKMDNDVTQDEELSGNEAERFAWVLVILSVIVHISVALMNYWKNYWDYGAGLSLLIGVY